VTTGTADDEIAAGQPAIGRPAIGHHGPPSRPAATGYLGMADNAGPAGRVAVADDVRAPDDRPASGNGPATVEPGVRS